MNLTEVLAYSVICTSTMSLIAQSLSLYFSLKDRTIGKILEAMYSKYAVLEKTLLIEREAYHSLRKSHETLINKTSEHHDEEKVEPMN